MTALSGMPSVVATSVRPPAGICVFDQISTLPSLTVRDTVLRLERGVRDERIGVRGLDRLGRVFQRRLDVAVAAKRLDRRLQSTSFSARAANSTLLCCAPRPSSHVTLSSLRALCACHQVSATIATPGSRSTSKPRTSCVLHLTFDEERVAHARLLFDLVEVGAERPAVEYGTFVVHGEQHAGHLEVDPIDWLARHDVVHVACRAASGR